MRVVLAIDQSLLRAVLETLLTGAGMEVLAQPSEPVTLLSSIGPLNADAVVIWTADSSDQPGICSHLLYEYPHLKIILLSPDRGTLIDVGIRTQRLSELSAEGILAALLKSLEE